MSLDNIVKKIKASASEDARKILSEADVEVGKIVEKKEKAMKDLKSESEKTKEASSIELKNAIILPANLEVRGAALEARQEVVHKVFKEALEFSPSDYKKVLHSLISQVPDLSGATLVPAKGKEEITKNFLSESGLNVDMIAGDENITGGFLVKSGKVEYDCTFDTLLKKLRDKLETEVAKELI